MANYSVDRYFIVDNKSILLDFLDIEKYDSKKMYKIYDNWPEIAEEAYFSNLKKIEIKDIEHIVFAGMGGSGAIGDTFASILSKTKIHVTIVKGYVLPNTTDAKSLVITTSISGNTIETLTILDEAKKRGSKIIAISSGGKMEKFCKENKLDFRKVSQIHSPRTSFVRFFYSILKILQPIVPITNEEIIESIKKMKELREDISSSNLSDNNPALKLATSITKIPLIYYPWGLHASAIRFKNSLQENSKIHAIMEDVIEASHNGIVAWENISNVQPILVEGQDDNIKTKERWSILKEFFEENKIEYKEIFSLNGNIITKITNLIYLFDYTSIYKAVLDKVDPSPVKSIDFIKLRL